MRAERRGVCSILKHWCSISLVEKREKCFLHYLCTNDKEIIGVLVIDPD